MGAYNVWSYTEADISCLANQAKEFMLEALFTEGLLRGNPDVIARDYTLVVYNKGTLGKAWDKFRGVKDDQLRIVVLRACAEGHTDD